MMKHWDYDLGFCHGMEKPSGPTGAGFRNHPQYATGNMVFSPPFYCQPPGEHDDKPRAFRGVLFHTNQFLVFTAAILLRVGWRLALHHMSIDTNSHMDMGIYVYIHTYT